MFRVFAFVAKLSIWWKLSGCWRLLVLSTLLRRHRQLVINSLRWFIMTIVKFVWGPLPIFPFNRSESIQLIFGTIGLFWHRVILRPLRNPIIYIIVYLRLIIFNTLWDTFVRDLGKIYFNSHVLASSGEAVWYYHSSVHLMHTFDCHVSRRKRIACLHQFRLSFLLFHHIINLPK